MKRIVLSHLIYLVPFLAFLYVIPAHLDRVYTIFPSDKIRIYSFTDEADDGNSEVLAFMHGADEITFNYLLKKGYLFPYTGLGFEFNINEIPQVDDYDYCVISLSSTAKSSYSVNLVTQKNKIFKSGQFGVYTAMVDVAEDKTEVKLSFSDFKIPGWWFVKYNVKVDSSPDLSESPLRGLEILSTSANKIIDHPVVLRLDSIRFEKNILIYYIRSFVAAIILLLFIILFKQWSKSNEILRSAKDTLKIHTNLDLGSESEREAAKLFDYLSKHYNSPYLSVAEVAKALNVSSYKIPKIINKYADLSFKQYLNLLRVDEAKKLLVNSDSKIIDIAYAVGYNSIAHFNKLFKEAENISPRDYRNKYQGRVLDVSRKK